MADYERVSLRGVGTEVDAGAGRAGDHLQPGLVLALERLQSESQLLTGVPNRLRATQVTRVTRACHMGHMGHTGLRSYWSYWSHELHRLHNAHVTSVTNRLNASARKLLH